ncbi:hypothetical protein [Corynebacterium glyciniphilum]|uniref:Uncharacterized protein n=1 Tax=Corynebacterium glyciniphilum AJ 3170 TaxID=1404245 RepID=X5DTC0_9CORY|nr:hypothetical protein [Corynebacterium glyciniphilum]AHW64539.1 Hypothetical protein CGLY_10470 [Corynebacterium glyciniphilum AJ 3170]
MSNQNSSYSSYTVNVVKEDREDLDARDVSDDTTDVETAGTTWCAAVVGVDGAVVWGDDFENLETAVRAKLADLVPGEEPELTWQIDSGAESSRQVPLNPM